MICSAHAPPTGWDGGLPTLSRCQPLLTPAGPLYNPTGDAGPAFPTPTWHTHIKCTGPNESVPLTRGAARELRASPFLYLQMYSCLHSASLCAARLHSRLATAPYTPSTERYKPQRTHPHATSPLSSVPDAFVYHPQIPRPPAIPLLPRSRLSCIHFWLLVCVCAALPCAPVDRT